MLSWNDQLLFSCGSYDLRWDHITQGGLVLSYIVELRHQSNRRPLYSTLYIATLSRESMKRAGSYSFVPSYSRQVMPHQRPVQFCLLSGHSLLIIKLLLGHDQIILLDRRDGKYKRLIHMVVRWLWKICQTPIAQGSYTRGLRPGPLRAPKLRLQFQRTRKTCWRGISKMLFYAPRKSKKLTDRGKNRMRNMTCTHSHFEWKRTFTHRKKSNLVDKWKFLF